MPVSAAPGLGISQPLCTSMNAQYHWYCTACIYRWAHEGTFCSFFTSQFTLLWICYPPSVYCNLSCLKQIKSRLLLDRQTVSLMSLDSSFLTWRDRVPHLLSQNSLLSLSGFPQWKHTCFSKCQKNTFNKSPVHNKDLFWQCCWHTVVYVTTCGSFSQKSFPPVTFPFSLLISAQVPDSDEQFVPDFHSENCEYLTFNSCIISIDVSLQLKAFK